MINPRINNSKIFDRLLKIGLIMVIMGHLHDAFLKG